MNVDLVTKTDLELLKESIIEGITNLLPENINHNKKWIRSEEAMKFLGCSKGTLRNLRINHTLPYSKLGGTIYFSLQDIENTLESNMNIPGKIPQEYDKPKTIHPGKN